ncbi:MAG: NAD kinase [Acholeplasmatales bacterium]|nr:NAD kinase [Acholeplasmatales bacterium]
MKYAIISKKNSESSEIKQKLMNEVHHEYDEDNPELAIAIGGDGTFLKAFHKYPNAIILGVNTGHLGFYSSYLVSEVDKLVEDLNNQKLNIKTKDLLSAKIFTTNGYYYHLALNEITILSASKALMFDVYIDDLFFERYRGTGLCISTPTGSTAFNKSLGGALIDDNISAYQIAEIAGINSNAYKSIINPVVLSSERKIRIKSKMVTKTTVVVDNLAFDFNDLQMLTVFYKKDAIKMVVKEDDGFVKRTVDAFLA